MLLPRKYEWQQALFMNDPADWPAIFVTTHLQWRDLMVYHLYIGCIRTLEMQKQSNYVFDKIRDKILAGELFPGNPIPERALGSTFGTSRVPIREAFIQLEDRGLITLINGKGAFVRVFSLSEIRDLYEVRSSLEGQAAMSAARFAPKEEYQEYHQRALHSFEHKDQTTVQELQELNSEFHDLVARLCHNKLLESLLSSLHDQVILVRAQTYRQFPKEVHFGGMAQHIKILEAIMVEDGPTAERRMKEHILSWFDRQLPILSGHAAR